VTLSERDLLRAATSWSLTSPASWTVHSRTGPVLRRRLRGTRRLARDSSAIGYVRGAAS
jgi:hypothetical protein